MKLPREIHVRVGASDVLAATRRTPLTKNLINELNEHIRGRSDKLNERAENARR